MGLIARILTFGMVISFFVSCGRSEAVSQNVLQDEIEDTIFYEEILPVDFEEEVELDFTWSFIEGKTELDQLQTDVGLLMDLNGSIDTVKFFTARGQWMKLSISNNGVSDFPEDCITAIESKEETCFWAVRMEEVNQYEILFGGIENNAAYAVLNYGYINRLADKIDYEVGDPEEVETYTQYGAKLY